MSSLGEWLHARAHQWVPRPGGLPAIPADLQIHQHGHWNNPEGDRLDLLWTRLEEREAGVSYPGFRALRLLQLESIPLNVRADQGNLARMRSALRGIYGTGSELVCLVAGIFHPERIGIVQCYGAVGRGDNLESAASQAQAGGAALEAALSAAYPQIRLMPVQAGIGRWIDQALQTMPHGVLAIGHPDPRENARGGGSELDPLLSSTHPTSQGLTLQQNELVMRGMAQLEEDFLLQVLLTPVSIQDASRLLAGLAEYTSTWAAWQGGSRSFNLGTSLPLILSGAMARAAGSGFSEVDQISQGHATSQVDSRSETSGWAHSETEGQAVTNSITRTHTEGRAETTSRSEAHGSASGESWGQSSGSSWNVGGTLGLPGVASINAGYSEFQSTSSGSFESSSQVVTEGQATTVSVSDSVSQSHAVTHSRSETETVSGAETVGSATGRSESLVQGQATGRAQGLNRGVTEGMAIGLSPSLSIGDSNQWQSDPAILLTTVLRRQQDLLNTISLEGGYYTDVYALARTERGRTALVTLIPEAFHGTQEVVTGVQTRTLTAEENDYLRLHARAMVPSTREIQLPEAMSAYADSTLLTMLQVASYLTPGLFEEGLARTVQEAIPPFAFDPLLPGEVCLGRMYSSERGTLTDSRLRLTADRHFHTAFAADTGFGKSVAAERLAYETTLRWHYRTIVLDFGQGWRKALYWPGLAGRVDIRQLQPGGVRPLRWNPLQVPRRVDPARYRTLVCELFANAGRMGPRQLGFLRDRLTRVYQEHGVLPVDPPSPPPGVPPLPAEPSGWEKVRGESEETVVLAARKERGMTLIPCRGQLLSALEPFERQALLVHRSRAVSLRDWIRLLRMEFDRVSKKNDQASRSSLQGILLRLEPLAEGGLGALYGPGPDSLAIEDLGLLGEADDPWGVAILEGGAEMDEFSKSALLSLAASILYLDAVVRRRESLSGARFPPMQIFFEEANKVLSGIQTGAGADPESGGANQTAQIFLDMWRDGRKYGCFLHVLAQSISELPPGILSSCNNGFFGQTKHDRDRAALLAHLARSTKGFVNSEYDRFLARMPVGMAVAKLGYALDMRDTEPYLVRPDLLEGQEPSDEELRRTYHPSKEKP